VNLIERLIPRVLASRFRAERGAIPKEERIVHILTFVDDPQEIGDYLRQIHAYLIKHPQCARAHYQAGVCLFCLGRKQEARAEMEIVLTIGDKDWVEEARACLEDPDWSA
jgi:hypothetical protein